MFKGKASPYFRLVPEETNGDLAADGGKLKGNYSFPITQNCRCGGGCCSSCGRRSRWFVGRRAGNGRGICAGNREIGIDEASATLIRTQICIQLDRIWIGCGLGTGRLGILRAADEEGEKKAETKDGGGKRGIGGKRTMAIGRVHFGWGTNFEWKERMNEWSRIPEGGSKVNASQVVCRLDRCFIAPQ